MPNNYGILAEYGNDYYLGQIFFQTDGVIFDRSGYGNPKTWTDWRRCDNFGCNTPSDLASLLGGRSYIIVDSGDCDNYTTPGTRIKVPFGSNVTHKPGENATWSIFTFGANGDTIFQCAIAALGSELYIRSNNSGSWNSWYRIPLTQV